MIGADARTNGSLLVGYALLDKPHPSRVEGKHGGGALP
jgi:hypothetical protein